MTEIATATTAAKPSARFWDRIAERYAKRPIADREAYERKLRITREYLRPDMEVLEFGCGTGSTAIAHAPFVRRILAIDLSSKMIEIAHRKAQEGGASNVSFACASIEEFQAPDTRFDAVLGLNILHLLADRDAAIAKVARMLKPGGIFVTNTACLGDTMRWFGLIAPLGRRLGLMPLVKVFKARELEEGLARHGFGIAHEWRPGDGRTVFIVATKRS